jgi:hypothetical protein
MNVKQGSYATVIHGNMAGNFAFVLWQENVNAELGIFWKVRFNEPQLSTRVSSDGGATFQDGIAFSRDALIPDAWLRPVERQRTTQLDVELHPPVQPPEVLDVQLNWPDGWLRESQPQ